MMQKAGFELIRFLHNRYRKLLPSIQSCHAVVSICRELARSGIFIQAFWTRNAKPFSNIMSYFALHMALPNLKYIYMIPRPFWQKRIEQVWEEAPIAWLCGVRRCGKTTLAESLGPERIQYVNCDLPVVEEMVRDPLSPVGGILCVRMTSALSGSTWCLNNRPVFPTHLPLLARQSRT